MHSYGHYINVKAVKPVDFPLQINKVYLNL